MTAGGLPAAVAIAGGLVLAVALFVPFAAVTYRREGALGVGDLAALVAVPVYGLALWTYTLLPLPDRDDLTCRHAQTHVLAAVDDVRANGTATLAELAHNPALLQVVLNVALFVPLGVLLRWRWRRGLPTAVVVGFAVSLLVELTQLTGIWGVYPCAYRLFDVDDLIVNTAGAALGWLVATAVAPHRHAERRAVPRMTFGRRLVAMVSDGLVVVLGAFVVSLAWRAWQLEVRNVSPRAVDTTSQAWMAWGVLGLVQAATVLTTGRTVGEAVVELGTGRRGRITLAARALKLAVGVGAFTALAAWPEVWALAALPAFVALTVVAAAVTRDHRGLANAVAGLDPVLTDTRADARATTIGSTGAGPDDDQDRAPPARSG